MVCPKCGNNIGEGAVFCPKCGYRVSQTQAQPTPQTAPQQNYGGWNNEPAPQYGQPAFGGMNGSAFAVQPEKEKYLSKKIMITIIALASLAMIGGIMYRAAGEYPFWNILFHAILPPLFMIAAAILINRLPPVAAIVPFACKLIVETIDLYVDWERFDRLLPVVLYYLSIPLTMMFLCLLLTRKKTLKIFTIILASLVVVLEMYFKISDVLGIVMWLDRGMSGSMSCMIIGDLSCTLFWGSAVILFALGLKCDQ